LLEKNPQVISFEYVQDFRPEVQQAFIALGTFAHKESAHRHMTMDIGYGLKNLHEYVQSDSSGVWIAWDGEQPVGFFVGKVHPLFFSKDLVAVDTVWYVLPKSRGSRVGLQLLELFEKWSESKGVKDIRIGQTSKLEHSAFDKIMGKRGYEYVGSYFVRKV
jgi:hypothetical protein